MSQRKQLDEKEYKKIAGKECFICNIVNHGDKREIHAIIDENEHYIAFLNNYPTQPGQSLVCPKKHVKHIFKDLTEPEYEELCKFARKIGSAIQNAFNAERMYLASMGSNELNDHVHFHIFPLPANTPFDEQQFAAFDYRKRGFLDLSMEEKQALAEKIKLKM